MIITPELIEKAGKAMRDAMGEWALSQKEFEALARPALTAILPDIVEAIAKVARATGCCDDCGNEAAAAIRSLALADKER